MIFTVLSATAIVGLGSRSPEITGGDPAAYEAFLYKKALDNDQLITATKCDQNVVKSVGVTGVKWTVRAPAPQGATTLSWGGLFNRKSSTIVELVPHEQIGAIEHIEVQGCGRIRHPNFLTTRIWNPATQTYTGAWGAISLLDGDSHAEPRLQMDAAPKVELAMVQAATASSPQCLDAEAKRTLRMGETVYSTPRNADGAWGELWPATVCGKAYTASVHFIPSATGPGTTTFTYDIKPASP